MQGSVEEWCTDPHGKPVLMGCSSFDTAIKNKPKRNYPDADYKTYGFRLVLDIKK